MAIANLLDWVVSIPSLGLAALTIVVVAFLVGLGTEAARWVFDRINDDDPPAA